MRKFIYQNKNSIMLINLILIVTGFIAHYGFDNTLVFNITFITASILGLLPIALQAYEALKVKVVSIDVLVTIAVIGAFVIKAYEESAIVTFLFLFGAFLEARTLNKTRQAIKGLTAMAPEKAVKVIDDQTVVEVDIDEVDVDDILLVKTGAKVPVDGIVTKGEGAINEATITGEPLPASKSIGAQVYAGTIVENGTLYIRAQKVGEDTVFGKIIELVEEAQDSKSNAEKFIDKFAKYYTPFVLLFGLVAGLIMQSVAIGVTILVLGCPGALVIGIPVSNVAGIGNGAKNGILLKGSEVIRDFSKVDVMVFDKTGTLTTGKPQVVDIEYFHSDEQKANEYLVAIERESTHPLAHAILTHFAAVNAAEVYETHVHKGGGISALISGDKVLVGNETLMANHGILLTKAMQMAINTFKERGNSLVMIAINAEVYTIIGIRDEVRPGIKEELVKLKHLGIKQLILLSGDNHEAVHRVANELAFDVAHGEMLPEHKAAYIKKLQAEGHIVAFVGDGVNDSPSLASAAIGIAMGSGTDVAIETSNVVLVSSNLKNIVHALGLTKKIMANVTQNIIIALGVVLFLIISLFAGDFMNMALGMFVHEGSILVVIFNAMRLLRFKSKN